MAAKALADLEPDADAWKTFYLGNKPPAYAVDRTAGTRPLWQELDNLDQAKSNYGAIVYNKAPAVLKQLEYLVGDSRVPGRACGVSSRRYAYAQRHLARPARRDRRGGGTAARRVRAGLHAAARACRWSSSGWRCGTGGSRGSRWRSRRAVSACELRRVAENLRCAAVPRRLRRRSALDRAHRGPARTIPTGPRSGSRSSCAAPSPTSPRPAGRAGARLRLRQRARLRLLPAAARLGQLAGARARRARRRWTTRSSAPCSGARCGTRCAPTGWSRSASSGWRSASCPRETDEQIVPVILVGWLGRAVGAYLRPGGPRRGCSPRWSECCWPAPTDTARTLRRAQGVRRRVHRARRVRRAASRGSTRCSRPTRWPASRSAIPPAGTS